MIDVKRERARIRRHLREAMEAGNAATLTLDQWMAILKHFDYQCAYCAQRTTRKGPLFQVLEHIVSVKQGGGTTILNCVPACISCNKRKDGTPQMDPLPAREISYVQQQLMELAKVIL